jgi:hypothetical protein
MGHEASTISVVFVNPGFPAYFVILSNIDRSSRMKVGRVILDRSAPGRSWAMMCESTVVLY